MLTDSLTWSEAPLHVFHQSEFTLDLSEALLCSVDSSTLLCLLVFCFFFFKQAYADYIGFILTLNEGVKGKKLSVEYKISEVSKRCCSLLAGHMLPPEVSIPLILFPLLLLLHRAKDLKRLPRALGNPAQTRFRSHPNLAF